MSTINQKEIINDTIEDNNWWDDFSKALRHFKISPI